MLDENLPSFSIKPSSSRNPHSCSIFLSTRGSEPQVTYNLEKPDPSLEVSKGAYAIALYDPYNLGILYADVLVKPEWTQPTAYTAESWVQNGTSPPQVPIIPETFMIQLHNPNHQVTVKLKAGTWNTSVNWKFEMPINSFRIPSSSLLDQIQNAPALSDLTPKVTFKWKRDGPISKDITCYMVGKNTDGKKRKEPDITVAFFKNGKSLTLYEPNFNRVEIEDRKGFEIVLLLSAVVIKDIFFNANREMFNMISPKDTHSSLKTVLGVSSSSISSSAHISSVQPVIVSHNPSSSGSSSFPTGRCSQNYIDQETERLKKLVAAEKKLKRDAAEEEERCTREMLRAEEEERRRREAKIEKETEKLRRIYGTAPVNDTSPQHTSPEMNPGACKLSGRILPATLRTHPIVNGLMESRYKLMRKGAEQ